MEVVMIVLGILFVIFSVMLCYMAYFAVRPKVHTLEYELDYLKKLDFMKDESLEIQNEHQITTFDGKKLWVGFVPAKKESKHFVVLSLSTNINIYQ